MVARTVPHSEARTNPKCEAAVLTEWNKLKGKVWDEENREPGGTFKTKQDVKVEMYMLVVYMN